MAERHREIVEELNSSSSSSAADLASLGKELSSLAPAAALRDRADELREERESLLELLSEASDANDVDLAEECQTEIDRIDEEEKALESRMVDAVLPKDEDDRAADAVLEVRAGTGGDEAALFAGELLSAYEKSAKGRGWKVETLSRAKTDLGGVKEAAISIVGSPSYVDAGANADDDLDDHLGPYGHFKFESGVHRVQRVPVNDVRIHTSAASVAVLPAPSSSSSSSTEFLLPTSELKIETFRASGAGGQHVNTTESAVRITHVPTGVTAAIQDERSQHKNKAKALKLVAARVRDRARETEARERGEARSALLGGGDRSERIRTYNYPQDRVTDHRCKHSERGVARLLDGGGAGDDGLVAAFAPMMRAMRREELLRELEEEEEGTNERGGGGDGKPGRKGSRKR